MDEEKGRQNFLFYRRWYEQMRLLPNEEKLLVYESICDYAFNHVLTEMTYYLESIMMNIRQTIDANERKQDAFCEKQRRNVMKRWERRGNKGANAEDTAEHERIPRNATEYDGISGNTKNTYNKEQGTRNKNKEQGTRNRNKEDVVKKSEISMSSEPSSDDPQKGFSLEKTYKIVLEEFNRKVKDTAIPQVKMLNETRKALVGARVKQYGLQTVLETIAKAAESDFCNGNNNRGWRATFDWIFRPNNFAKTAEGTYDNRQQSTTTTTNNTQNGTYPQRQNYQGGRKDIYGRDADAYEQRTREFEAYAAAKLASSDPDKAEEFPF